MDCTNEKYLCLSSVNVANFVTVRPQLTDEIKSKSNFKLWKKQLLCLVESQDMACFITGEMVEPQVADKQKLWRRSDRLVQGWILGSLGTDVLRYVCELETAREVWLKLKKIFNDEEIDSNSTTHFETASKVRTDYINYVPLFNAALSGDWKTANELFFKNKREETEAFITVHEGTALHLAVRNKRASVFVQKLVDIIRK